MTFSITLGAGNRSTKGQRATMTSVEDLARALTSNPTEIEGWWSGHLWQNDSRRKPVQWEASQVVVVDCDYHDRTGKHATRPGELDLTLVPCSFSHLSPRGARFGFVLEQLVTDPEIMSRLARAAGALVNQALAAGGELADRDEKGKPVSGYLADAQTQDLARFMYRACTVVKGEERAAQVHVDETRFDVTDILAFEGAAASYEAPKSDVGKLLAAMPAEGEQDGSLALIKVCARAIRLGVTSFESFALAAQAWNAKRARPWPEDDMRERFEAALARFREQGMVLVPTDEKGRPAYGPDVLDRILREDHEFEGKLSYDAVKGQYLLDGAELEDADLTRIRVDLIDRYGFRGVPKADVIDGAMLVAEDNAFDRVKNYLEALRWDGTERLAGLAREVLGAEGELAATMVRRWFISAVARGLEPGCKVDTCLILQGEQGIGKSTFFRRLVPHEDLFTDTVPHDLADKDAKELMSRFWVVEYGEWDGLYKKTDIAALRTFLSTLSDSYRPPYGRVNRTFKRRAVLVGTVNPLEGILRDPEGSRRQWVVECQGMVGHSYVEAWRDQLWAEAVHLYRAGVEWWLTDEEDAQRAEMAERYTEVDPEVEALEEAVERLLAKADVVERGYVTMRDIAGALGLITTLDLPLGTARKAGRILREKKFSKCKPKISGKQVKAWALPGL